MRKMKMTDNWEYRMEILNKRKRMIEIAETIDRVLYEWYSERGREVPNWKKTRTLLVDFLFART